MNRYLAAIKRMNTALEPISQRYDKGKLYFWLDSLWAHFRFGVTPNQYIGFSFYEKSALERKQFYTIRQEKEIESALNDVKQHDIFWNKQEFNQVFHKFVKRDWLYVPSATKQEIADFISTHKKVLVKPSDLSAGRGIHVYKDESIDKLMESKALLEEFVVQSDKMSQLNPSSVNTIRIYTILDKINKAHILSAVMRVGGGQSDIDNYHTGGVGYPIDIEHGVISAAGKNISGERFLYHPSTGTKMIGFEIPNWEGLCEFVFEAANVFTTSRLIAWDVAILEEGFEMIEGNYDGDPGMMQSCCNQGKLREIRKYI